MKPANSKKQFLDALRENHIVLAASRKTGISKTSYYRWRQEDPKFAKAADEAIHEGIELVNDAAEGTIVNAIKNQDTGSARFWLKHHHPAYATKIQIETAPVDDALTEEEMNEVAEVAALALEEASEPAPTEEPKE
jgi:hypothetical protein